MNSFSVNTRALVSSKRRKRKNSVKIFIFFGSVIFFGTALVLFFLKGYIPRPDLKSSLASPQTDFNKSVAFRKEIENSKIDFESLTFSTTSATLILKLDKDSFSYLNLEKDPAAQVKVLSEVLNRIEIQNAEENLDYIDLRFEKAVVKYK